MNVEQLVPVGSILAYAGDPDGLEDQGWLVCDGTALPRQFYTELWEQIGAAFGTPDDDRFNLPDLRGVFLRGVSEGTARDPGAATRRVLQPGGNDGARVGSWQTYATALPADVFKMNIAHSNIVFRKIDHCNQTALSDWTEETTTASVTGGDVESRPQNKYVYFIVKFRLLNPDQEYVRVPIGAIIPFPGMAAPGLESRWLHCDGRVVAAGGEYTELARVLKFAHGKTADGQQVMPDYRGYFLRGVNGGKTDEPKDPAAQDRTAPYPAGSEGHQGNAQDAVGSVQPQATALPLAGFQVGIPHLPTKSKNADAGAVHWNLKWGTGSSSYEVNEGGDPATYPRHFRVNWYIRAK